MEANKEIIDEKEIIVGIGQYTYKWIDNWVKIPLNKSSIKNGRTHGVAATSDGHLIIFHQGNPAVLIYDAGGRLIDSWGNEWEGAHGLCLIREDGEEFLWLTDEHSGIVAKTDLQGYKIMEIQKPEIPVYNVSKYSPTWVVINEERFGGNGDIWIADGYGASIINRYDKYGNYISSITGEEGSTSRFNCPHGIWIDARKTERELYIADRGNKIVQVYTLEGKFKRSFGQGVLTCPCAFVSYKNTLFIPELSAKLTILDKDDNVVGFIGENEGTCSIPGWPDHKPELIVPGKFNSPHSAAVDRNGNIYVVEWVKGGRITKLEKFN